MVLFPSSIVVQEICFSLKVKSLEIKSCHFAEMIVVEEMLTNYLFQSPSCACCGFPQQGEGMNAGRAGTSTVVGKLLFRTRQATLVAQPLVSRRKLSSLTLVGQNLGPRGVKPPPRRRGHWGGRPLLSPCPLQTSIGCGHSCPLELQECCVQETQFKYSLLQAASEMGLITAEFSHLLYFSAAFFLFSLL